MGKNDIRQSPAFQEFLQKRCEEITESDEIARRMDSFIFKTEKDLKSNFSKEKVGLFLQYEKMVISYQEHIIRLAYMQGYNDRLALK